MRLEGRTTAGITLMLGVLAGLGLVILPGIVASPSANSTSTFSNSKASTPSVTFGFGSQNNQPSQVSTASVGSTLAILLGLVLFPAIALALFVRHWTLRQAKGFRTIQNDSQGRGRVFSRPKRPT